MWENCTRLRSAPKHQFFHQKKTSTNVLVTLGHTRGSHCTCVGQLLVLRLLHWPEKYRCCAGHRAQSHNWRPPSAALPGIASAFSEPRVTHAGRGKCALLLQKVGSAGIRRQSGGKRLSGLLFLPGRPQRGQQCFVGQKGILLNDTFSIMQIHVFF